MNGKLIQVERGKTRSSNLELYRIMCMIMIVAHHYVVNSGLSKGIMLDNPTISNSLYLWIFGMWGKTGINCFLMITGYFMCKSQITLRKFLKLMLQICFYNVIIFLVFLVVGRETITPVRLTTLVIPIWGVTTSFVGCFILFWLTIPFWNILISHMTKRQHQLLLSLLIIFYSILPLLPTFPVDFNYVTWFGVIYLLASYIRLYPHRIFSHTRLWGFTSIASIFMAILSVYVMFRFKGEHHHFFVSDSNKFLAVAVAVSTFLWIKNINIPYSRLINTIGASTFGVLLIHANCDAMRQWLWKDTVNCVGHYNLPIWQLIGFSIGVVLSIFITCIIIDFIRIKVIEEPFFRWFDKKQRFVKLTRFLTE